MTPIYNYTIYFGSFGVAITSTADDFASLTSGAVNGDRVAREVDLQDGGTMFVIPAGIVAWRKTR